MKKFVSIIMMLMMALFITSCNKPTGDDGPGTGTGDDVKLFEEKGDGLLLVSNNSQEDFVLFYDSVRASNLLGGVRGGKMKHRVKLPDSGKMYIVHAVKYSDYKEVASDAGKVSSLKVIDSALVYSDPTEDRSCEVGNPKYSGACEIRFQNQTSYYIEVGNGSPHPEDVFYTMRPNSNESAFVSEERNGYTLYMSLYLPIKKNGKIIGIQRQFVEEYSDKYQPTPTRVTNVTISSTELKAAKASYDSGYVRVVNNFSKGFSLENGAEQLYSTLDHLQLPSGVEEIYELKGGRKYTTLKLSAAVSSNNKTVPEFEVKNGWAYTIEIKADGSVVVSNGFEIDPEEEEINWSKDSELASSASSDTPPVPSVLWEVTKNSVFGNS